MTVTATAPLRIDIGGGITDIPEFGAVLGTSVSNIGIDLFGDASFQERRQIKATSKFSSSNTLSFNRTKIDLNVACSKTDFIRQLFLYCLGTLKFEQPVSLSVTNTLPSGTGLGGSATLALVILGSLHKLADAHTNANILIKLAHYFETKKQGIQGGFQDYIGAYFGGLNYIDFSSLQSVDLEGHAALGQRIPTLVERYLNKSMIFVIKKSKNISSGQIVANEIYNFERNRELCLPYLQTIKECNMSIYSALTSTNHDLSWMHLINKSWEAQKNLSHLVGAGLMSGLENRLLPLTKALRGPGAGGNSLLLIVDPAHKRQVKMVLREFEDQIVTLYGRVNNQGLTLTT